MTLLIAGGRTDPNLAALVQAALALGLPIADARVGTDNLPEFHWELENGQARLRGDPLVPCGAFLRHDVFSGLEDSKPGGAARALGWSQAIQGWLYSEEDVRIFNRNSSSISGFKPAVLCLARQVGLRIPKTQITNAVRTLRDLPEGTHIAKPVAGGDYCYSLEDSVSRIAMNAAVAPMPAIVQQRLVAPEIRIYVIGRHTFAFEMRSASLDYRLKQDAMVIPVAIPTDEAVALQRLMSELSMDFGAADFKTDPVTGKLVFLELNTSPMFARFDFEAKGALCKAMVEELTAGLASCAEEPSIQPVSTARRKAKGKAK